MDLQVEARGLDLVITGEFKERDLGRPWRRRRPAGPFRCRVTLPGPFDPGHAGATLAEGVLTVMLRRHTPLVGSAQSGAGRPALVMGAVNHLGRWPRGRGRGSAWRG